MREHVAALRKSAWDDKVANMREGRVQKAHTFRAKKGKGSYTRKPKNNKF